MFKNLIKTLFYIKSQQELDGKYWIQKALLRKNLSYLKD